MFSLFHSEILLYFFPARLLKASNTSIGVTNIIVLLWSELRSFRVWRVRKCNAPGEPDNLSAALAKLSAAITSPLALIITEDYGNEK